MKESDSLFFVVLLLLGGVAAYLYLRKGSTIIVPKGPSGCDQLLGAAVSTGAATNGVPVKVNAPVGLCAKLEKLASVTGDAIGGLPGAIGNALGFRSGNSISHKEYESRITQAQAAAAAAGASQTQINVIGGAYQPWRS